MPLSNLNYTDLLNWINTKRNDIKSVTLSIVDTDGGSATILLGKENGIQGFIINDNNGAIAGKLSDDDTVNLITRSNSIFSEVLSS